MIHVAFVEFKDSSKETVEVRGYADTTINYGVVMFKWEVESLTYPLDAIHSISTSIEEE